MPYLSFRIEISLKFKPFLNPRPIALDKASFAAKESLSKAIGTGFRNGINFKDISITNDKYGKPNFKLNNNVKKLIYSKYKIKKFKISLSLADEKKYSIAFSVIHK